MRVYTRKFTSWFGQMLQQDVLLYFVEVYLAMYKWECEFGALEWRNGTLDLSIYWTGLLECYAHNLVMSGPGMHDPV